MDEKEKLEKILDAKLQNFKEDILSIIMQSNQDYSSNIDSYIDVSDVSKLMNISKKTVRKYYSEKKLAGEKDFAGRLRFKRKDVENFILNIQKDKYGL